MTIKDTDRLAAIVRGLARLEVAIDHVSKNQESLKGELRTIVPRLDTLIAEVREVGRLVHRQAGFVQAAINEVHELVQAIGLVEDRVRRLRDAIADFGSRPDETGAIEKPKA